MYHWSQTIDDTTIIENKFIDKIYRQATFLDGKPVKTAWGSGVAYGWETGINSGLGKNRAKGGQFIGYMGTVFHFPESGITMIVLSNVETDKFWGIGGKVFECLDK